MKNRKNSPVANSVNNFAMGTWQGMGISSAQGIKKGGYDTYPAKGNRNPKNNTPPRKFN